MEKLEKCKLYKLNKKKTIYEIFSIPLYAQKNGYDFSMHYDFLYIDKSKSKKSKLSKLERIDSYITLENKKNSLDSNRPVNFNNKDFRVIVNTKSNWLKSAQRKFHKLVISSLENVPYLHSTIKKKSYATNAHEHLGDKYFLKIDIESFFTKVNKELVQLRLKTYLDVDNDVAKFYANMLTSPKDKPPFHKGVFNLGQGLPSSPILAFLCHKSFFDYLYNISKENNILMTIYVDDIAFSSDTPIKQEFIDRLFGLFIMNNLKISKKKFRYYKKNDTKKITGIFIKNGNPMVPSKKHEEIKTQYEYLLKNIKKISNIDDYFLLYNLYLRFAGNVQHLISSECTLNGVVHIKKTYNKYKLFIDKYSSYFPRGINKTDNKIYNIKNISSHDLKRFNDNMEKLIEISVS